MGLGIYIFYKAVISFNCTQFFTNSNWVQAYHVHKMAKQQQQLYTGSSGPIKCWLFVRFTFHLYPSGNKSPHDDNIKHWILNDCFVCFSRTKGKTSYFDSNHKWLFHSLNVLLYYVVIASLYLVGDIFKKFFYKRITLCVIFPFCHITVSIFWLFRLLWLLLWWTVSSIKVR